MPKKPSKPEPISKHIVCSECGLSWEAHGESPSHTDCIRLLKAELAKRSTITQWHASSGYPITTPLMANN